MCPVSLRSMLALTEEPSILGCGVQPPVPPKKQATDPCPFCPFPFLRITTPRETVKRKNKQAQSIIVSLLVSLEIQRDKGVGRTNFFSLLLGNPWCNVRRWQRTRMDRKKDSTNPLTPIREKTVHGFPNSFFFSLQVSWTLQTKDQPTLERV